MIRAFAMLVALAGPAHATVDGWPALFDVTGVASDDFLNVRAEPGPLSEIVGKIAPDAEGIEVIRPNERETWGLVNVGERSGWVSLTYLARRPGQWSGAFPEVRQCFGTEPFWSLSYDPPRIALSMPDIAPREGLISGLYSSLSRRDRFALRGSFFPTETGDREIHLSVRTETCNDGMSDREFGVSVDMLVTRPTPGGDQSATGLYSGCCSIQPPAE